MHSIYVLAGRMKNIVIAAALTLLYIFLLTVLFENFVNKASSTLLTALAAVLFLAASFLYVQLLIKTFKNPTK